MLEKHVMIAVLSGPSIICNKKKSAIQLAKPVGEQFFNPQKKSIRLGRSITRYKSLEGVKIGVHANVFLWITIKKRKKIRLEKEEYKKYLAEKEKKKGD